jgi:hypothetical protein
MHIKDKEKKSNYDEDDDNNISSSFSYDFLSQIGVSTVVTATIIITAV